MKTYPILIFTLFVSSVCLGQSTYDFPVQPGTDQWRALENYAARVAVCQLPENVLYSSSTEELLEICLDYPFLGDIMLFNNVQSGIDAYRTNFNGASELMNRKDIYESLFNKYSKIRLSEIDEISKSRFVYRIRIQAIELLLSQDEILLNLSINQQKELVKMLIEKQEEMAKNNWYGYNDHRFLFFTIARIVMPHISLSDLSSKEQIELEAFSSTGYINDNHVFLRLYEIATLFVT